MTRRKLLQSFSLAMATSAAAGQNNVSIVSNSSSPNTALYNAARQATISLALDRPTYFPSEKMQIRMVVTNPTANLLRIPDPFDARVAAFDTWRLDPSRSQPPENGVVLAVCTGSLPARVKCCVVFDSGRAWVKRRLLWTGFGSTRLSVSVKVRCQSLAWVER